MDDSKVFMFPDAAKASSIDPNLLLAMNNGGGFGGNNWIWILFLWLIYGNNGWGNNGFGGNNGTGYLANQISNSEGRDLLLQAINGRADAASQLAQITNSSVETVKNGIFALNNAINAVANQVGMSGLQVQNAIQSGDAAISRQLCECCCENRLAIANQTNALQAQAAANHAASTLLAAQTEAADQLAVCQQTNTLTTQADRNTRSITDAIAAQSVMINDKFCELEKRELEARINTQSDIITQLRGQLDNDRQTAQLFAAINPLQAKVNEIANKQPNTVPVQYPNLVAVNATPYGYPYGMYGQTSFWN